MSDDISTESQRAVELLRELVLPIRPSYVAFFAFVYGWAIGGFSASHLGFSPEQEPWMVVAVAPVIGIIGVLWMRLAARFEER